MKVSILIPAYRSIVTETLESVYAQTFQDFEIILIHQGGEVASPNADISICSDKVNRAASIAKGEYLLVLSDDDKLTPDFLEKTVKGIEGYDICYTDLKHFGEKDHVMKPEPYCTESFIRSTVPWITSLVRKSVWDELGGWSLYQDYGDWDFWYRCFKSGKTANYIPEPLFLYRLHKGQGTNNMSHLLAREKMKKAHPEIIL